MDKILMKAKAKVNLSLDVIGKQEDGYHKMKMINYSIDFFDRLEFSIRDSGIVLRSDAVDIPLNQKNLVVVAAEKFISHYGINKGVDIFLKKEIPHGAGLAGGSSDAAATLMGLNKLFGLNLLKDDLCQMGLKIGADVPYCIYGNTALVEGIGQIITPLPAFGKWAIILIKPDICINTAWAFKQLDLATINHPDIDGLIKSFATDGGRIDFKNAGNAFEKPIFEIYPELKKIKQELLDRGAEAAIMTGSGSTLVGYYANHAEAKKAFTQLKKHYQNCYYTQND